MIYENIELTRQVATAHWGWTIAFFLWFVGLGGMTLVLNAFAKSRHLFFAATGAIVVGTLLVVSHLARLLNLPFAAINALLEWKFNFGSWMFIGICILAVTCVVTVVQAWFWWKGSRAADSKGMLFIDAVLGFASTAYSGFLLTQAVGVPLWTTAVLPVLWVFSGLSSAVGLMEVERLCPKSDTKDITWLGHVAHLAHWGEAFVLFAFVSVAFSGTPAAVAGASSLVSGDNAALFWSGAVGIGIIVPILVSWFAHGSKQMGAIAGLCAILGALALRASVLFAGAFDPVIF